MKKLITIVVLLIAIGAAGAFYYANRGEKLMRRGEHISKVGVNEPNCKREIPAYLLYIAESVPKWLRQTLCIRIEVNSCRQEDT